MPFIHSIFAHACFDASELHKPCARLPACRREKKRKGKKETYQQDQTERLRSEKVVVAESPSCPLIVPELQVEPQFNAAQLFHSCHS
jgi:hypothetical protein